MTRGEITPISKNWTPAQYAEWFSKLETKKTPTNTAPHLYEIKHTGGINYLIKGGGVEFWADGIRDASVIETKMIVNPPRSPYIAGSKTPDFIREKAVADVRGEFDRVAKIVRDDGNPLTSMRVITNDAKAVPFFESLLREYNIPGGVIVAE